MTALSSLIIGPPPMVDKDMLFAAVTYFYRQIDVQRI